MVETCPFFTDGYDRGEAAGSWFTIENAEHAARIVKGYDDGDPEVMDMQPSALSGEWAGESLAELGLADASDEDLSSYEDGYSEGFWAEVLRMCRVQLEG